MILLYYLLALVPIAVGGVFWWRSVHRNGEVVWYEWLIGSAVALLTSGACHLLAIQGLTSDVETWSGQLDHATFHPEWVERYTREHSSGSGKNRRTWTTTHYRTHHERWETTSTLGDVYGITSGFFDELRVKFGSRNLEAEHVYKSGFSSGDNHVYHARNQTGYVYPVTTLRRWSNRVKASPSLFSFSIPPPGAPVFPWPDNPDWRQSDRLVGTAAELFDRREFDLLNSRLGPTKRVNLIFVGWPDGTGVEASGYQEAAWVGGKKNDLVVCFAGMAPGKPAQWSKVFGWTESDLCKRNIESLFITHPPSDLLLGMVEQEVQKTYVIKDWAKFSYLRVEPPPWTLGMLIVAMVATQTALWWFFHTNEMTGRRRGFYA